MSEKQEENFRLPMDETSMFTVFVSASSDLKDLRDAVHETLVEAGVHAITQDKSLGAAPRDVRDLLATDIAHANVVLHIAGEHYGADAGVNGPPFPDCPEFECSWTQFEYYYAHSLGKDVYSFVMASNTASDEMPRKGWSKADLERRKALQLAHRARVVSGSFAGTPIITSTRTLNDHNPVRDKLDMLTRLVAVVRRSQQDWGGRKDRIVVQLEQSTREISRLRRAVVFSAIAFIAVLGLVFMESFFRDAPSEQAPVEFKILGNVCEDVAGFNDRNATLDLLFAKGNPEGALEAISDIRGYVASAESGDALDDVTLACWQNVIGETLYRNGDIENALVHYAAARDSASRTNLSSLYALAGMNEAFTLARLNRKAEGKAVYGNVIARLRMIRSSEHTAFLEAWVRDWELRDHPSEERKAELGKLLSETDWRKLEPSAFAALGSICSHYHSCPEYYERELKVMIDNSKSQTTLLPVLMTSLANHFRAQGATERANQLLVDIASDARLTVDHRVSALQTLAKSGPEQQRLERLSSIVRMLNEANASDRERLRAYLAYAKHDTMTLTKSFSIEEMESVIGLLSGVANDGGLVLDLRNRIALLHGEQQNFELQLRSYEVMQELAKKSTDLRVRHAWMVQALRGQALTNVRLGQIGVADQLLTDALQGVAGLGDGLAADILLLRGELFLNSMGNPDGAIGLLQESLDRADQLENADGRAWRLFAPSQLMAYAYRAKGDFEQAKVWFEKAYAAALLTDGAKGLQTGQNGESLGTLINWGNFLIERGEHQGALVRAEDAWKLFELLERNDPTNKWIAERGPEVLRLKAKAHEGLKQFGEAITIFERAEVISSKQTSGDPKLAVGVNIARIDALFCLARVLRSSGDEARAKTELLKAKEVAQQYLAVLPEDAWVKWVMEEIAKLE